MKQICNKSFNIAHGHGLLRRDPGYEDKKRDWLMGKDILGSHIK